MISLNRLGMLPPLPLTREVCNACFSKRRIQSGQRMGYIPSGRSNTGEYLYDRALYPVLSPQIYMINHTPRVSSFLWQRELLNNRQQKNAALQNYLFGLSAWSRDVPELARYAKEDVGTFTPASYDILCQPEGQQPISIFSHPQGRTWYWQFTQQYPTNALVDAVMIYQYQKMARFHHDYLASQLEKNTQQLVFNGASYPSSPVMPAQVYHLQDVVRHSNWLQAPEQYPAPLLKSYKPEGLDNRVGLLFAPASHDEKTGGCSGETFGVESTSRRHRGPEFARCFHRFPQPVSPPDAQVNNKEDSGFDERLPRVGNTRNTGSHPPYKKGKTNKSFVKKHYAPVPGQQIVSLEEGISCLEGIMDEDRQLDSRKRLDQLFNDGQLLFANSAYSIKQETTLRFIKLFRDAVKREKKQTDKEETDKQKQKKQERLHALDKIREYVDTLSDSDVIELRLAVQLCGRVRERSQVRQREQRYCGGFAILQAVWGSQPLRAVQIILNLAKHGVARIEDKRGGINRLMIPEDCNLKKLTTYREALADILPLCTLYNCTHHKTAKTKDDAINAVKLGLAPMIYQQNWLGTITGLVNKKQNKRFIEAFCKASKYGIPIRGGVGSRFSDYLIKIGAEKRLRKPSVFRKVVGRIKDWWSGEGKGHAVLFENFRDQGKKVEFKVHTWGRVQHLVMNKELFLSLIDKRRFLITDITPMDSSIKPKRLGRFVDVHYLMDKEKL